MRVSDIIDSNVHVIYVNDAIEKALNTMTKLKINGMPVVDSNDKLVGIVVKADIFRFMIAPGHYSTCPVEWVMTKPVISVQADEDVLAVTNKLRKHNIVAMPVLDNEKVIGLITIENLLDYYVGLQSVKE